MKQFHFTTCITFVSVLKIIVSSVPRLYKLPFSCSIYSQNVECISLLGATYYFIVLLNMFRALLCSSSGADDYNVDDHIGRLFLGLL